MHKTTSIEFPCRQIQCHLPYFAVIKFCFVTSASFKTEFPVFPSLRIKIANWFRNYLQMVKSLLTLKSVSRVQILISYYIGKFCPNIYTKHAKMSPCVIIESDSAYNLFPVFAKASRLTLDGFLIFFPSIFLQKQPNPALDDRRDILRGFIAVKIRGRFLGNNL